MERIEKLRKRALEFDYCKDEFYYLFYREYAKNVDANEQQRYSEALYAALSELTPYIGEEELIVGEYHCALSDEEKEEAVLYDWVRSLPEPFAGKMKALYDEMAKRETKEAKVYKAIDSREAVIQHNFSAISTWLPREYDLNVTYANDKVAFSEYLTELREEVRKDTLEKIEKGI